MKQALLVLILMSFVPSSQDVYAQSSDTGTLQPGPNITELKNGVPVSNLSGAKGSEKLYRLSVTPGASNLKFYIAGGTGDADLYVKYGAAPTASNYTCRPLSSGNNETCDMAPAKAGHWYVLIRVYKDYSGLTLVGSYSGSSPTEDAGWIQNGSFEGGSSPWVLSWPAIYLESSTFSRGGSGGHLALGQAHNSNRTAYQEFTIPDTATSANLTFYLRVASDETRGNHQYDKLYVEVRNSSGSLFSTLATYSNLNKGVNYIRKGVFNLLNYKGQTIRVQFRATNDASLVTTFRIDDVSVK